MALIIEEYDGFTNPESVKLDKIETWCLIHKLPDGVLKNKQFVENMAKRIGEVLELQIVLPSGFVGEFIRARVKLNVNKKLTRFVSFTKSGKTEFYQVKFEKLPVFCYMCGILGHWHEECGTGEHTEKDLEWGPFIMAPRRGRGGRGRGSGRGSGRGGHGTDEVNGTNDPFGRGRGAGFAEHGQRHGRGRDGIAPAGNWGFNQAYQGDMKEGENDINNGQALISQDARVTDVRSWRFNAQDLAAAGRETGGVSELGAEKEQQKDDLNVLGKRVAEDSGSLPAGSAVADIFDKNSGAIVPLGNTSVIIDQFEAPEEELPNNNITGTPQKNVNKKKLKGGDGMAVDSTTASGSAASMAEDRRGQ